MGAHIPSPTLTLVPFRHVQAFADVETRQVFVSARWLQNADENIRHELAHIVSADPDHGESFRDQLDVFGGTQPPPDDEFKRLRKRLGIPPRIAANIGNISGIQNMLLDYHLLQAYRKFSQKILGTEGHWEVINEGGEGPGRQLIRLTPTPKGVFPVVVLYYPVVTHFRSPQAKKLCMDMVLAEAKVAVGMARRKIANMPSPTGGNLQTDGDALVQEGNKERDEIAEKATKMGEPLGVFYW